MVVVWLALIGTVVVTAILVIARYALTLARGQQVPPENLARWAGGIFAGNFVLDLLILYFAMPALTGPYNGWQWLLWPLFLTGVVVLFASGWAGSRALADFFEQNAGGTGYRLNRGGRRPRVVDAGGRSTRHFGETATGLFVVGLVLVTAIVVNGLVVVSTTWFDPNVHALARLANVQVEPKSATLPPTDVQHIVLVSQGVAAYLGQQVLASNGQNLGSLYNTDPSSYTLQSVKHHLYWIAPLVYNNLFVNLSRGQSPGYVYVDAENPDVQPTLVTKFHLRYLPGAILNQDLIRHVYLSGYTYGNLVDPTLEVDDNWNPYFTISLLQPTRGFTGNMLKQVLLVDPQTGHVTAYAPDKVPSWIDRVMPADTVIQYLNWWGQYNNLPWFNPSGAGQQAPSSSTPELVYNNVDKPVWLVPMTSNAASDNSTTGVVLYDTHDTVGHFYPLGGLGATGNVVDTFKGNPKNLRDYSVSSVQLYQIYGVPTWVAIFVQQSSSGENFAAVGMVDARHLIGSNVIMASTKADALSQYAASLGAANSPGTGASSSGQTVQVRGKVARISSAVQNGSAVYYIYLQGQSRIYTASLGLSPELPLVREGDTVQVSYVETGQTVVPLTAFDDLDIQLATPTAVPSATP